MPYSQYNNLAILEQKLHIKHKGGRWFDLTKIHPIQASTELQKAIELGLRIPSNTEKARSENLISPVLKEVFQRNENKISYFSGYGFHVDDTKGLNGNCDYLFAAKPHLLDVQKPVFCLVEAKNGVVETGYAQCAAEMYAAKLYNAANETNTSYHVIYGAVSNGLEWHFMQLEEEHIVLIDNEGVSIRDLNVLLGVFQFIVNQFIS